MIMQNGWVYFLGAHAGATSIIAKIGFTGREVHDRVGELSRTSPLELDIFGYFAGTPRDEQRYHRTFAPLRLHGEWFRAEGKLLAFMRQLAAAGGDKRPATAEELNDAIWDVIIQGEHDGSSDVTEWTSRRWERGLHG